MTKSQFWVLMGLILLNTNIYSLSYFEPAFDSKQTQFIIDSNVNIRDKPSIQANILGKLQKGDPVKIINKTEIKIVSEQISDWFYEVETPKGNGYVFGGFISDFSKEIESSGKKYTLFSKQYNISIAYPDKINSTAFDSVYSKLSEDDRELIKRWYTEDNQFYTNYYQIENLDQAVSLDKIISKYFNSTDKNRKIDFSKLKLLAKSNKGIIETEYLPNKIKKLKVYENAFDNVTIISIHQVSIGEAEINDDELLYVIENNQFTRKRRLSYYSQSGIYQGLNKFVFPNDIGGKKNTIIIKGENLTGNTVDITYQLELVWNGKDFIEKK